jgi:hypothetical protein
MKRAGENVVADPEVKFGVQNFCVQVCGGRICPHKGYDRRCEQCDASGGLYCHELLKGQNNGSAERTTRQENTGLKARGSHIDSLTLRE